MKCIKSTIGTVLRVTDEEAEQMISKSNWVYCSKKEWKEKVRDVKKEVKKEDAIKSLAEETKPKKTKKPKRNRRKDK